MPGTSTDLRSSPSDVDSLGGPSKVVTPLATLRFDAERKVLVLESAHPPHTPREVAAQTGFDLGPLEAVPATAAPSPEELATLRGAVRSRMIETGTYAAWAERTLGAA